MRPVGLARYAAPLPVMAPLWTALVEEPVPEVVVEDAVLVVLVDVDPVVTVELLTPEDVMVGRAVPLVVPDVEEVSVAEPELEVLVDEGLAAPPWNWNCGLKLGSEIPSSSI